MYQQLKNKKSPGWQWQKLAGCQYPRSATGQRFTKKPSYCKQANLQESASFGYTCVTWHFT